VKVLARFSDKMELRAFSETSEAAARKRPLRRGDNQWVVDAIGNPAVINGIPANTGALLHCVAQMRDRVSLANWRTVQRLARAHQPAPRGLEAGSSVLDRVLPACTALAGYAFDDMTRDGAWRFLVMGRQLERIAFLSFVTQQVIGLSGEDCEPVLSSVLDIGNINMTYLARYQRRPELLPVLDLLVLDESNPHSICFQLEALDGELQKVRANLGFEAVQNPRTLLQALRAIDLSPFENRAALESESLSALLMACQRCAAGLSNELTQRFFIHAGERPQSSVAA
jgi:uncharacterized alpha-E superfamily protein